MEMLGQTMQEIKNVIQELNAQLELPEDFLVFFENKDYSFSLKMVEPVTKEGTKRILKVAQLGKKENPYISMMVKKNKLQLFNIPEDITVKNIASDTLNSYLIFTEITEPILNFIKELIFDYVNNFEPSEKFGCCHRYKECSEAKKCLHPDQFYSKACWYRKNLESGKIFY